MGNILMKCKECFQFYKRKPITQMQTHQLVNLSNNPEEETQGKINAQQISFIKDPTQSNERTISQIEEKNEHEITLETISNQQLSALRSSEINSNQIQNEQQELILNEECQKNPNLDSPNPPSYERGQLIKLPSIKNINISEFKKYAEETMIEYIQKKNNQFKGDCLINRIDLDLNATTEMRNKKFFLLLKFQFDINTKIEKFINWLNGNKLFESDLIKSYNVQKLNEQISIGEIILNRQVIIKQQYLTYLKIVEKSFDGGYTIAFKSVKFQDKFEEHKTELYEGYLALGGLSVTQHTEQTLQITGLIEVDLGIRLGFNLIQKQIREKFDEQLTKLREQFI